MQSRSREADGARWEQEWGRSKSRSGSRPGTGLEHGRSMARAGQEQGRSILPFLANISPDVIFHGQKQRRSRAEENYDSK